MRFRYVRLGGRMVASAVATILAASIIIYCGLSLTPGDPAAVLGGNHPSPALVAGIRHDLGLDRPLPARYASWLSGVFHGKLGESIVYRERVNSLIGPRIGTTLLLAAYALVIVAVLGIGGGLLPALVRRSNPLVSVCASVGVAVPSFVAALVLIQIFALEFGWFPVVGGGGRGLGDKLVHLTLPAFALAISFAAFVAQFTRVSVRDEETREHVETARGRGFPVLWVFRRHVLRNAAVPIVTVFALTAAGLISSTIIVEQVFDINGIGSLLIASVLAKDTNVVQAISMIYIAAFVFATMFIDLAQLALDPRIRAGVT